MENWSTLDKELEDLKSSFLYRSLKSGTPQKHGKIICDGKELVNFSSNNYLGISEDLNLQALDIEQDATLGSTASRLIAGNHPSFQELESRIAALKETESALVFSCGYMANIGVISTVVGRGDAVFSDRLNHASITDGIRLSAARHFRYHHKDVDHLESLLRTNVNYRKKFIVTESLFSMDGDLAPLKEIVEIKRRFNAILMVDEAHSGGIYGHQGAGLVNQLGLGDQVEVQMGTFSKAYGCYGAYVAGKLTLRDYLINKARSFIYTTGLSPIITKLNLQALQISMEEDWRRTKLFENAEFFRAGLLKLGLNMGESESFIIPVLVGDESKVLELSKNLWQSGIAAYPIRPPTVPKNSARIRFSLSASHKKSDLEWALKTFEESIKFSG